jgi:hypothetical protein
LLPQLGTLHLTSRVCLRLANRPGAELSGSSLGALWELSGSSLQLRVSTALYPSCCLVAVPLLPRVNPLELPTATSNSMTVPSSSPPDAPMTNGIINFLRNFRQLIQLVSNSSIGGFQSKCFAVADTGATNHIQDSHLHLIQIGLQPPGAHGQ